MDHAVPDAPAPYATVVFDCDSTLSAIEGIDELAAGQGAERRAEIAGLTDRAMRGELRLEEVYGRRLALLRPTRAAIAAIGRAYVEHALPEARELVAALVALEKRVALVSGGLHAAVSELARELGIPARDVFAVEVFHDAQGGYAGFDQASPLATHEGKREIVARLAAEADARGVVCVGDGMTDLLGARAARRFVAFGGVVRRASVFERARARCDAPSLAALLPWLCDADELRRLRSLPAHRRLMAALDRWSQGGA